MTSGDWLFTATFYTKDPASPGSKLLVTIDESETTGTLTDVNGTPTGFVFVAPKRAHWVTAELLCG